MQSERISSTKQHMFFCICIDVRELIFSRIFIIYELKIKFVDAMLCCVAEQLM